MSWQEYENEPISNLIEYVQWKDQSDYRQVAEDAFKVLCFRFRNDVIKKCRIISKNWRYDTHVGDTIAERTFARFWKYPKTFTPSKCKKELDDCFKFYLFAIAQTQLADYRKEVLGIDQTPYTGEEEIVYEFPNLDALNIPSEARRDLKKKEEIIKKALERLTPKHRIVYLTYKAHEINGRKMPRPLLKTLRDELELTQSSIQVYKKEAYDKVDEYLSIYGAK
jgi:DNA-directed RNA polymerase specialized sigma24 family protein